MTPFPALDLAKEFYQFTPHLKKGLEIENNG